MSHNSSINLPIFSSPLPYPHTPYLTSNNTGTQEPPQQTRQVKSGTGCVSPPPCPFTWLKNRVSLSVPSVLVWLSSSTPDRYLTSYSAESGPFRERPFYVDFTSKIYEYSCEFSGFAALVCCGFGTVASSSSFHNSVILIYWNSME